MGKPSLNKKVFSQGMQILSEAFSKSAPAFDDTKRNVFYSLVSDIPDDLFQRAVIYICRNEKFFPVPSEIIQASKALSEEAKSGDEAWKEVREAVQRLGLYNEPDESYFADNYTFQAVSRLGWKEICICPVDQISILRAQFRNLYENLRKNEAINSERRTALSIQRAAIDMKLLSKFQPRNRKGIDNAEK